MGDARPECEGRASSIATLHRAIELVVTLLDTADVASKHGATSGQIALAWLLHKGPDVVPIPGTKRRRYLEENAGAAAILLSPGDMQELDAALAADKIAGPRYGTAMMAMIDR